MFNYNSFPPANQWTLELNFPWFVGDTQDAIWFPRYTSFISSIVGKEIRLLDPNNFFLRNKNVKHPKTESHFNRNGSYIWGVLDPDSCSALQRQCLYRCFDGAFALRLCNKHGFTLGHTVGDC
jgi:hypothetical protein